MALAIKTELVYKDARIQAPYMLGSTARKSTQCLCVIQYEMHLPPNV